MFRVGRRVLRIDAGRQRALVIGGTVVVAVGQEKAADFRHTWTGRHRRQAFDTARRLGVFVDAARVRRRVAAGRHLVHQGHKSVADMVQHFGDHWWRAVRRGARPSVFVARLGRSGFCRSGCRRSVSC